MPFYTVCLSSTIVIVVYVIYRQLCRRRFSTLTIESRSRIVSRAQNSIRQNDNLATFLHPGLDEKKIRRKLGYKSNSKTLHKICTLQRPTKTQGTPLETWGELRSWPKGQSLFSKSLQFCLFCLIF